jgi:hypothetical protein
MRKSASRIAVATCLAVAWIHLTPQDPSSVSASPADSVFSGICEGSVLPFGIILPPGGFEAGCSRVYVLKHGTGSGDRGRYGLLDLPPCPAGPCANPGGQERLSCELLHGNYCCTGDDFVGHEVETLAGSKTGPYLKALTERFWSDTDHDENQCYSSYAGNGQRVLRVIALAPIGMDQKSFRVAGFARFFMRERPDRGSDDLVGEFVPTSSP